MYQFETRTIARGLKGLAVAAVAGAALMTMATPASAASIFLDKGQMYNAPTVNVSGWFFGSENMKAGPVLFTANDGTAPSADTYQFLGFSVDLFDDTAVGASLNLKYQTGSLTNNGSDSFWTYNSLDAGDVAKINKLVTFGTGLWNADTLGDPSHNLGSTLANQLAAVQGAIWQIENPYLNIDGSSAVDGLIDTYTSTNFLNGLSTGDMTVIHDTDGRSPNQTFAFVAPMAGVPEPATWGLMLVGFGGLGAMLRRRRAALAYA